MRKMSLQAEMSRQATMATPTAVTPAVTSDWRHTVPMLAGAKVTLRELRGDDAPTLFSMLSTNETARFISPPPTTIEGFQRFVDWAIRERELGNYICFAVVPEGMSSAIGLFQVRALEPGFATAEWGFALGSPFWGSGIFADSARLVLDFAFETMGIHRLEARASIVNGRGNGALRKLGAVQEGVLRRSFLRNGAYHDQVLWSLLKEDWQSQHTEPRVQVH